jgi:uncharacterized protein (TIGR03086 family)
MTEISDRYLRLSDAFADRIRGVAADQWGDPTPCPEWTVRDLVRHVATSPAIFFGMVGREMAPTPDVDDDPLAAFLAVRDQVAAALEDPARAGEEYEGMLGRATFAEGIDRFISFDLVVHGWDLARATGQDERLDPDDVGRTMALAQGFGEAMRAPKAFGPEVEPPPGASEQERLLAFLGRTP